MPGLVWLCIRVCSLAFQTLCASTSPREWNSVYHVSWFTNRSQHDCGGNLTTRKVRAIGSDGQGQLTVLLSAGVQNTEPILEWGARSCRALGRPPRHAERQAALPSRAHTVQPCRRHPPTVIPKFGSVEFFWSSAVLILLPIERLGKRN